MEVDIRCLNKLTHSLLDNFVLVLNHYRRKILSQILMINLEFNEIMDD